MKDNLTEPEADIDITETEADINIEEKQTKKKILKYLKSLGMKTKIIAVLVIIGVLILSMVYIVKSNQDGKFSTISKSSLQRILQINELSTLEFDYNAVAKKYADDDKSKDVEYYVAYDGTVTAGIDFNKIEIGDIDKEGNKITVTLPDIEIQDVNIDEKSLDYIFIKDKYETETIFQEAYKVCKADLKYRVENENLIKESARENAVLTIKGLFEPMFKAIDESFIVEVK